MRSHQRVAARHRRRFPLRSTEGDQLLPNLASKCVDVVGKAHGVACSENRGVSEPDHPVIEARRGRTKSSEPGDVAVRVTGENGANRNERVAQGVAAAKNRVDEGSAGSAVAVDERVDGFELRVSDCGPDDGVAVGDSDKSGEVIDKSSYLSLGRWNEVSAEGAPPRAADPVLLLPQPELKAGFDDVL